MYPAGELLMEHGKILNDNSSSMLAGTQWSWEKLYYEDSLLEWSSAAYLLSIVCLATLCARPLAILRRAATILRRTTDIRSSAAPRCGSESRLGPPETGFLSVLCSAQCGHRLGKIFRGGENILSRKYLDDNVSGAVLCHNWDDKWWLEHRTEIMRTSLGLEAVSENHDNRPIVCIDRGTSLKPKNSRLKIRFFKSPDPTLAQK